MAIEPDSGSLLLGLAVVSSKEMIDQLNGEVYVSFLIEEIYLATFIVHTDLLVIY